jgi:hypothetical protein
MQAYRQGFQQRERVRFQSREIGRQQAQRAAKAAILAVSPNYLAVQWVYLYGSILEPGWFRKDSDINVGIVGADMALCFDIWRDLERQASVWAFDVRPLELDDPFSERIREKGELIYERGSGVSG